MPTARSKARRLRPACVPPDARWNARDQEWEHGEVADDGRHVGVWRWWRSDGSLVCESSFDEAGLLHGAFARYHPDGTPSRSGTFAHGRQIGRETFYRARRKSAEHFPVASRAVVKVVVEHDGAEERARFFDEEGRETTEDGVPLSEWRNDRLFVGAHPHAYAHEGLDAYLRAYAGLPKRLPRVAALDEFEEVWGIAPPPSLVAFVRATAPLADSRIHELRPAFGSPRLAPKSMNMVETLIFEAQKRGASLAIGGPLAGVVPIGEATNGDTWCFGLYDHLHSDARGEGQVYLYAHEEHALGDPVTPDVGTFAYLSCVCDAFTRGVLSERAFSRAYGRLRKKVLAGPHFAELEAIAAPAADASFAYKSGAILPRFFFFRALWIEYLLQNNGTVTVEDMPRVFVESANEPITEQSWTGWLERAPRAVPIGLYVLFRCFFFDDEARLSEAVRACGASESRILRDAAKLVAELQDGRKTLGTIRNVKKLKAQFLELDMDPNRREQREREREKDGTRSQARSQRLRVAAVRAIDAGVSLEDLAWEKVDDASAHDEVLRAMRDREEMRTTLAIVDYIDHDGHAHDNLILEHEREEALLALDALGDRAIVPLLVGRARRGDRKAVEMLAALKDPRAVPHLLALLDGKADRYHHFDTAVVHALRTHGARGSVPKLLAILARNPLVDWRTGIERGDLVQEVVLALGALGDRGAAPALLKVLAATNKEYDEVHPLAAGALGALGVREAFGALAARLERSEGVSAEEIWAFGEIAAKDEPAHEAARVRLAALPRGALDATAEIVRVAAIAKLGGDPVAFGDAILHALATPGHRKVDTSRQQTWTWRCFGELGGPTLDPDHVRYFLTTDDHDVRAAATRALARRSFPVPDVRPYFVFALDGLDLPALHRAVKDPWGVFRYNVALRLARLGDRSSIPVLCDALRAFYLEPATSTYEYDDPPYHLRWFARALGSFDDPTAAECLIEGLSSANHHVRQIVASDPPKDDRVVPALVRLLDDARPLLRSRAQHALESFKKTLAYARAMEERDHIAEA